MFSHIEICMSSYLVVIGLNPTLLILLWISPMETMTRLCVYAGLSEPLLLGYLISTKIFLTHRVGSNQKRQNNRLT